MHAGQIHNTGTATSMQSFSVGDDAIAHFAELGHQGDRLNGRAWHSDKPHRLAPARDRARITSSIKAVPRC